MDLLFSIVSGFVQEVGRFVCNCVYPKIENTVCFSSNIENLRKETEKLTKLKDTIKEKVERAEREGYKPKPDVLKWLEDVETLENEWESMQESIAAAKTLAYKCFPNCGLSNEISTHAQTRRDQLGRLKETGENFGSNLVVENYQMKRVEFIPGPSIECQSAATRNLCKLLRLLEDDKVFTIGVWGMGGVGKTTLVKSLNNELLETAMSSSKLSFGVVVWVTVPKPTDIRKVQAQIANRLELKVADEESLESIAGKIHQRLKQEKSFLLILDDVWEAINLDDVGVPRPEDNLAGSKLILTSRFRDVCRQMRTDEFIPVVKLDEDESWKMFVDNAGDDANLEHIEPLAKGIARECNGLPLALTVIGKSMRGKKRVELWRDALESVRMSEPHNKDVKDKVYTVIKWSFDSLVSPDDPKHVNKRRGDIQSCFLYCSLYPMAISTDDLIHCWWAEGFLGERNTYEETYDGGITIIESLKDACLLESHELDSVKMHDVVRDVAIWIANSLGDEHNSVIQAGNRLAEISHVKMSASVKRISFVSNEIESLPDCFMECPETTTLLLQDNRPLTKIPREFLLVFPTLRVLNLSSTGIRKLPSSISSLHQLRALILQNCRWLRELPPIGNLCNLQLLDCAKTSLRRLPQGMDKLTDLRLLNVPNNDLESIGQGILLKLSSIEMINMLEYNILQWPRNIMFEPRGFRIGSTCLDELSSLQKLTSLFIRLDESAIVNNRDYSWMTRLKSFSIIIGPYSMSRKLDKSKRTIMVNHCKFNEGELSGMLQFASDLNLSECSFGGLQALDITDCSFDFRPMEEGSRQFDSMPNLEYLYLSRIHNVKSVSDLGHLLGVRFSKLRHLEVYVCDRLTYLFYVGGAFSVSTNLEEIRVVWCVSLVELFVDSEIPSVRKLRLERLPNLGTLGETWEHLEELTVIQCEQIRKLPLSIQTSNNIKVIRGKAEWWNQLEWDDDNFKSDLEHCFRPVNY